MPTPVTTEWVWVSVTTTGGTAPTVINVSNCATTTSTGSTWICMGTNNGTTTGTSYSAQQQALQMMLMQQYQQQVANQCNNRYQNIRAREPTPEERAAEASRQEAALERDRERGRQRAAAMARARELLLKHLTSDQRETVEKHGWFVVEGGYSKRPYRINTNHGYSGNVYELDAEGREVASLCCHAAPDIPVPDQHLAQKLMLEHAEDEFLRMANRSVQRRANA